MTPSGTVAYMEDVLHRLSAKDQDKCLIHTTHRLTWER